MATRYVSRKFGEVWMCGSGDMITYINTVTHCRRTNRQTCTLITILRSFTACGFRCNDVKNREQSGYKAYPVSLPGWASPGNWLGHWSSSDITSKRELIFICPLLQPSFEAVQGISRYSVFVQVVPPFDYPFTAKSCLTLTSVLNRTF